ncbi:hypothetical protein LTR62_004995 [Meristemomyces frigidus]|uniref:Uncharacterized protein n=1 Tax=Meristemomyces frigidus TaxID=1508187 RepID=A0AAN7YS82_9PEZI|nr:hypothetical protein LTR62_004995 [Meristemomyces frigidus]
MATYTTAPDRNQNIFAPTAPKTATTTGPPPPAFPTDLPPRVQTYGAQKFRARYCSSPRTCLGTTFSAYSLKCTGLTLFRRICMYCLLLLQLALGVVECFGFSTFGGWITQMVFMALFICFTVWNLGVIDRVQGSRRLFGVPVGRQVFTYFLFVTCLIYGACLAGWFFEGYPKAATKGMWFIMSILIGLAAWLATTIPEPAYSV